MRKKTMEDEEEERVDGQAEVRLDKNSYCNKQAQLPRNQTIDS